MPIVYVSQLITVSDFVKKFNKNSCKKRYKINIVAFCKYIDMTGFWQFVTFCEFID